MLGDRPGSGAFGVRDCARISEGPDVLLHLFVTFALSEHLPRGRWNPTIAHTRLEASS